MGWSMGHGPSLLPREHGAYAQLIFPLLTGLALSVPSSAALALALAAVTLFLANEPLAILMGVRGERLKSQLRNRAAVRAALLLGSGVALGFWGIWRGGSAIWPEMMFPMLAGILLVVLAISGRQKTILGELVVVATFSTMVLPLAAASGAEPSRALAAAGVWWLSFSLGTVEVHAIKARVKKVARRRWTLWLSPIAAGTAFMVAFWAALGQANPLLAKLARSYAQGTAGDGEAVRWISEAIRVIPPSAAALLPPALTVLVLSLTRVHPKNLKRVGWTLVGANALALLFLMER